MFETLRYTAFYVELCWQIYIVFVLLNIRSTFYLYSITHMYAHALFTFKCYYKKVLHAVLYYITVYFKIFKFHRFLDSLVDDFPGIQCCCWKIKEVLRNRLYVLRIDISKDFVLGMKYRDSGLACLICQKFEKFLSSEDWKFLLF